MYHKNYDVSPTLHLNTHCIENFVYQADYSETRTDDDTRQVYMSDLIGISSILVSWIPTTWIHLL